MDDLFFFPFLKVYLNLAEHLCGSVCYMATYTTHSVERRAERGIKQAYIELCLRHGTRRNIESTPSPFHSGPFINKTHYKGLIVLSVPNTHPPTVITAYWTVEVKQDIDRCIAAFDQRLRVLKEGRDKHAAKVDRRLGMDKERRDKQASKSARSKKLNPAKINQANSLKKH